MKLINPGPSRAGWHRLQNVMQCPRKYALATDEKKTSRATMIPSPPLIKGSLLHMGLAHHYAQRGETQKGITESEYYDPVDAVNMLVDLQPKAHKDAWAEWVPLITEVLLAYTMHWSNEHWIVVDNEKELLATIPDKERDERYLYSQRVDSIWQDPRTQKVWFVDHKTSFRITSGTAKRYELSGQFIGYTMLGRALFKQQFGGVLVNFIGWPQKNGLPKFERVVLGAAPHALEHMQKTLVYAERVIHDHKDIPALEWPGAHHENACVTQYGPGKFFDVCKWGGMK